MRGGVLEARSARRRAVAKHRTVSESGPADARRAGVLGKPEEIGGALAQIGDLEPQEEAVEERFELLSLR